MNMNAAAFDHLAAMLKGRSGLALTRDKDYLVATRLRPVAQKHGFESLDDLCRALRSGGKAAVENDVVEAMTTNESYFFRDVTPFASLRETVLPELVKRRTGGRKLRFWSAACSSGQEAYSIAIVLAEERAKLGGCAAEIVGTDLSREMVARARAGAFSHFEVQRGLPIQYLPRYFQRAGEQWTVAPALAAMASFRTLNLLEGFETLGIFDVVFCRNVLIYFDQPTKSDVLRRIARQMPPDGYLFLGGAETVLGISDEFVPEPGLRGVYRPAAPKAARG